MANRSPKVKTKTPNTAKRSPGASSAMESSQLGASLAGGGGSYVNITTPEETVLETYFVMLSKFNFERAREQCEREREAKSATGSNNWCEFMTILGRLAILEATYFSLSYLERSRADTWRLSRRETLRTTCEALNLELKRVHEVYSQGRGGTDFSWERKMTILVSHIMEYITVKRDMSDFYVRFDQTDNSCHLDYPRMEKYLKEMHERFRDSFQHPYLKPLRTTFMRELTVLTELLNAQKHIAEWQFLPAILALQSSHNKLTTWSGVVPLGTASSTRVPVYSEMSRKPGSRSGKPQHGNRQSSPPPQAPLPYLYRWVCKFHATLLAKFSLYFNHVLTEHASVYDIKHLSGKLDTDYIASLTIMVRQTPSICACLVFDSNGVPDFKGPKYRFPDTPAPTLTGINSYPIMISVPYEFDFHHHRPNIVSTVVSRGLQLNSSPALVSQYDEKLQCMYYYVAVEFRVTFVVISSARAKEKDSKTTVLLTKIASQLRNSELAALLKPGS